MPVCSKSRLKSAVCVVVTKLVSVSLGGTPERKSLRVAHWVLMHGNHCIRKLGAMIKSCQAIRQTDRRHNQQPPTQLAGQAVAITDSLGPPPSALMKLLSV